MRRGISGFGIIFYLLLFVVIGYIGYQIARIYFTYGSMSKMVESVAEEVSTQTDFDVTRQIMEKAKEMKIEISPDSMFVERIFTDSIRVYVAYSDSSSIFDFFYFTRHFVIDKTVPIKVRL
jgi:type III secretion system FlhB-like substrate exporter